MATVIPGLVNRRLRVIYHEQTIAAGLFPETTNYFDKDPANEFEGTYVATRQLARWPVTVFGLGVKIYGEGDDDADEVIQVQGFSGTQIVFGTNFFETRPTHLSPAGGGVQSMVAVTDGGAGNVDQSSMNNGLPSIAEVQTFNEYPFSEETADLLGLGMARMLTEKIRVTQNDEFHVVLHGFTDELGVRPTLANDTQVQIKLYTLEDAPV